jgi:hypothetical protein
MVVSAAIFGLAANIGNAFAPSAGVLFLTQSFIFGKFIFVIYLFVACLFYAPYRVFHLSIRRSIASKDE